MEALSREGLGGKAGGAADLDLEFGFCRVSTEAGSVEERGRCAEEVSTRGWSGEEASSGGGGRGGPVEAVTMTLRI